VETPVNSVPAEKPKAEKPASKGLFSWIGKAASSVGSLFKGSKKETSAAVQSTHSVETDSTSSETPVVKESAAPKISNTDQAFGELTTFGQDDDESIVVKEESVDNTAIKTESDDHFLADNFTTA
jgi:hypothetical protein